MKFISNICLLWICIGFVSCKTAKIPDAYDFKIKEIQNNSFGCWTIISIKDTIYIGIDNIEISGELIAIEKNLLYLLTENGEVDTIKTGDIQRAQLFTHKNQASNYLLTAGLFLIPNILGALVHANEGYAGSFLILGIPTAIFGIVTAAVEGKGKGNILNYPQNPLSDLKIFARFPGGIPSSLNCNNLLLKK